MNFFGHKWHVNTFSGLYQNYRFRNTTLLRVAARINGQDRFVFLYRVLARNSDPNIVYEHKHRPSWLIILQVRLFSFLMALLHIFPHYVIFVFGRRDTVTNVFQVSVRFAKDGHPTRREDHSRLRFVRHQCTITFRRLRGSVTR